MTRAGVEVGVDIGGTFTDVVLLQHPRLHRVKVPTTSDQVSGVLEGLRRVLGEASLQAGGVVRFVHGSTVATNAVLERSGATVAVLTTEGFEDVLEIGRQKRSRMYDLVLEAEVPVFLAPRRRRWGIPERMGADGVALQPLDEEAVREAVRTLVEREQVQAIAVCYLFSFANAAHERRTREIISEFAPDVDVSLSSDIDPQEREYERLVVTGFDAYLRGVIRTYVASLERQLVANGVDAPLQIMQSRGGIASAEAVTKRPVTILLSGLAGGVLGSSFAGSSAGFDDLISLDMGGTSCDVALIREGTPLVATEGRIDRWPLRIPMVDVNTIGAGGGSIAWVDDAGGLRVGPASSGSDPGPACYARGGTDPTVTDASVVLGYLNPQYFAGGELVLDAALSERAVGELGTRVGLDLHETARGIHRIVNARMADEIRMVSVRRGYDHRDFSLLALGGAGPTHGAALLRELGLPRMVVPSVPGVLSALGLLVAPVEHDQVAPLGRRVDDVTPDEILATLKHLEEVGTAKMAADRVDPAEVVVKAYADVRYVGQSHTITIVIDRREPSQLGQRAVAEFTARYEKLYGHSDPSAPTEITALRTVHTLPLPPPRAEIVEAPAPGRRDTAQSRPVYFIEAGGFVDTPVLLRSSLRPGSRLEGPLIVEQADTTTVVLPGQRLDVGDSGTMIVTEAQ